MLKMLFKKKDGKMAQLAKDIWRGNYLLQENYEITEEILEIVKSQQEAIKNLNDNVDKLHKLIKEGKRSE